MRRLLPVSFTFTLSLCLTITACGPGKLFGPTFTPTPTNTLTPTATPTPTLTFTPSSTPTLTLTPSSTPTFTPSPTHTLSPTPTPSGGSDGLVFEYFRRGYSSDFDLRGSSNIFFANIDGSQLRPITTDGLQGYTKVAGVSPDGNRILLLSSPNIFFQNDCHLYIANLDGSGTIRLDTNTTQVEEAKWLPNGIIAYIANDHIYLINSDGSELSQDKWTTNLGQWPLRITGYSPNRLYFQVAKGIRSSGFRFGSRWWMKLDGSGLVGEIPRVIVNMGPLAPVEYEVSPDGTKAVWFDRGVDRTLIVYIAPLSISDSNMTIDEKSKIKIPLPGGSNQNYVDWVDFKWSPTGTFLWIMESILSADPTPTNPYAFKITYIFFIWNLADSSATELPILERENVTGGYFSVSTVLSPDGRQVLITDKEDYIAILNLSTMELFRKFGCSVSKACPDKPNVNLNKYNPLIDTIFWLPIRK